MQLISLRITISQNISNKQNITVLLFTKTNFRIELETSTIGLVEQ